MVSIIFCISRAKYLFNKVGQSGRKSDLQASGVHIAFVNKFPQDHVSINRLLEESFYSQRLYGDSTINLS